MALPLIIVWILAVVGGGIIGALIAISVEEIVNYFSQKRICILGERRVGKTILFDYLSQGVIHTKYYATTHSINVKGRSVLLDDLKLVISAESMDVTGNPEGWTEWKKSFKNADYVLYLFRADLVFPSSLQDVISNFKNPKIDSNKYTQFIGIFNGYLEDIPEKPKQLRKTSTSETIKGLSVYYENYRKSYIQRFKDDVQLIKKWQESGDKPIVFVGTHGDFIPKFDYLNMLGKGKLYDTFRNELYTNIPELSADDRQNIVVGAFTNEKEFQYYTTIIFKMLKNLSKETPKCKPPKKQASEP